MRKNTARHWLHAALDLLPVILIPVFMIYSHRHVLTERTEVDIQYKYQSNEVNSLNDLVEGNIYNFRPIFDFGTDSGYPFSITFIQGYLEFDTIDNVSYAGDYLSEYPLTIIVDNLGAVFISFDGSLNTSQCNYVSFENSVISYTNFTNFKDYYEMNSGQTLYYSDFSYTDYNIIESVNVQDTNSSIMNVFMDDFNYSVNKYFNMGNVFNLKDVYHWFEVNIFNNNPPVVMASIYNIIVYEFVMDLLFLLYGLFMWFVDMLKRLIEKPIDSIK